MESCWKTLWETAPCDKWHHFWKRGSFSLKYLKTSGLKPFLGIWKQTYFVQQGYFLSYFSCNYDQFMSDLLLYVYVGINLVRILVFDNMHYQKVSIAFKMTWLTFRSLVRIHRIVQRRRDTGVYSLCYVNRN